MEHPLTIDAHERRFEFDETGSSNRVSRIDSGKPFEFETYRFT
jgi:hypothetical protein